MGLGGFQFLLAGDRWELTPVQQITVAAHARELGNEQLRAGKHEEALQRVAVLVRSSKPELSMSSWPCALAFLEVLASQIASTKQAFQLYKKALFLVEFDEDLH